MKKVHLKCMYCKKSVNDIPTGWWNVFGLRIGYFVCWKCRQKRLTQGDTIK